MGRWVVDWAESWLAGRNSEWLACCLPAGYSGVHKPHCKRPHILLVQQRQPGSLTGWMPDFWVKLVSWLALDSPSLFLHVCLVSQLSSSLAFANGAVYVDLRGHWSPCGQILLMASAVLNILLRFSKTLEWKGKTESNFKYISFSTTLIWICIGKEWSQEEPLLVECICRTMLLKTQILLTTIRIRPLQGHFYLL